MKAENPVIALFRKVAATYDPDKDPFDSGSARTFVWRAQDLLGSRTGPELARRAQRPRVVLPAAWRRRLRQAHRMPAAWEALRREVLDLRRVVDAAWGAATTARKWSRAAALDERLEALEEQLEAAAWDWYSDRGDTERAGSPHPCEGDLRARDLSAAESALRSLLRDVDSEPPHDASGLEDEDNAGLDRWEAHLEGIAEAREQLERVIEVLP